MRELLTPHEPIRYRAEDFLALWRCNESGATLIDETGGYNATVITGTVGAAGGLFSSPAGTTGARTFSSSRATAAGTTAARTALLGDWTISAWVRPTSITASAQVLLAYAGGNTLASLGLAANTGAPFVLWRHGTTDVTVTANTGTSGGSTYHVAAVKDADPANAGKYRVTLYIDGVARGTTSNLTNADGGTTSPQWNLGTNGAGSLAFGGTLDDVAVLKYAATAEMVRDIYARGASSVDAATTYAAPSYEVAARVTVYTAAGVGVDLTSLYGWDLVRSVSLEDDVDNQGATCRVEVVREVYEVNVAPLMATSAPNVDAGGELLALNRRLVVETATIPDGAEVTSATVWEVVFDGYIEGVDYAADVVSVEAMDKILPLQDTWIEPDRTLETPTNPPVDRVYGSNTSTIPVETDIAQLIADNVPPTVGYVGGTPALYTPTSPGWAMNETTTPSDNHVAGKIGDWVGQIGWLCRYKWDDHRKTYRLTLYEPERTKTWSIGDPSFTSEQVLDFGALEVRRDEIRNVVEVEYGDAGVPEDNTLQWKRLIKTASDATSITKYGRRYCRVSIGTVQEIDDAVSAQKLADAIIADLKDPKADAEVSLLYRPYVEIGDVVRLDADGMRFSSAQAFAVVSVSHVLSAGERRTSLRLRSASPIGRRSKWWDYIVTPGRVPAVGLRPLSAPTGLGYTPTVYGVQLNWTYPRNAGSRRYLETEIHRGSSAAFTPSASTLVSVVRGKASAVVEQAPDAVNVYYRFVHRDDTGTTSPASAALLTSALSNSQLTQLIDEVSTNAPGLVPQLPNIADDYLAGDGTWKPLPSAADAFGIVAVAGQTNVVAETTSDTLTLVAGSNVTITTNASADSVTISASQPTIPNNFGTIAVAGQSNVVADANSDTLTLVAGSNVTITTSAAGDSVTINASQPTVPAASSSVVAETSFGASSAVGTADTYARGDHTHGTPPRTGILAKVRTETTAGTFSWNLTNGVTRVFIEVIGGGGGGGGADALASNSSAGGGGGAGGYAAAYVTLTAGTTSLSYQVGNGGGGGAAAGGAGNDGTESHVKEGTTFLARANGGTGGTGGTPTTLTTLVAGGTGGTGVTGDVTAAGAPGAYAWTVNKDIAISGHGGASALGGGGISQVGDVAGSSGGAPGAGGSGGVTTDSTIDKAGGNGAAGMVRIWEFY